MPTFTSKRFTQLTLDTIAPESRELAQDILKISSLGLAGPYNVMLRSPVFADRMKKMLDYLRWNSSIPMRLSELAILIQARSWTSQVEWHAHYTIALREGLPAHVADDIKQNIRPRNMQPDEAAVYDVCTAMIQDHQISDELFNSAKAAIGGEQQIVDIIAVSGTYITIAMLLSLGEEPIPEGKPLPFPEKVRPSKS